MILSAFGKTLMLCPLRDTTETTHNWRNPFTKTSKVLLKEGLLNLTAKHFINSSERSSEIQGSTLFFYQIANIIN